MAKKNTIKVDTKKVVKKEVEAPVKDTAKKASVLKEEKVKKETKKETLKPVEKKEKTVAAKAETETTKKVDTKKAETKTVEKVAKTDEVVPAKKETAKATKAEKPEKEVKAVKTEKEEKATKEAKVETKKETKAKEEKPANKKTSAKTTVKASEKPAAKTTKTVKEDAKATAKKTTKKAAPKKATTKKVDLSKYDDTSLDFCLMTMKNIGVNYDYADYTKLLLDEADVKVLEKNIIEGNQLADKKYDFAKDGFDLDIVMATLHKVAETMDVTAAEFKTIKKDMDACVKVKLVADLDENSKNYLNELRVAEKVLMVGQRKNISTAEEATALLKSDVDKFFAHFKAMAYAVLRNWKYEDVEFYQEFAFAFVSQYTDMYTDYQNEIQMDCADLYILHGDEGRGDHEYNYVLRENEIKDYIYYRFANVYVERNLEKAKSIAHSAFQWVDDRYDYYKNIVEIIEK